MKVDSIPFSLIFIAFAHIYINELVFVVCLIASSILVLDNRYTKFWSIEEFIGEIFLILLYSLPFFVLYLGITGVVNAI